MRHIERGSTSTFLEQTRGLPPIAKEKRIPKISFVQDGSKLMERPRHYPVSKSDIMGWLRARLSFTVLRAVITCLRGCRSLNYKACIGEVELAMKARLCRDQAA